MVDPPARASTLEAFQHRNFALFWGGALLSNSGTWVQNVTVPYVVFQLTGDPAWVGRAAFAQLLPMAVCSVIGGTLADRYQRRSVLLVTQFAAAGVALALWITWQAEVASVGVIVALVAVGGAVMGLNIPAWQAFVTELVPRETLLNAVTLNSAQFNAARAFGPAVGGLVLAQLGVGPAFLINAVSFAAVIVALVLIRVPTMVRDAPRRSVVAGFADAARYARSDRGILAALAAVIALGLFGMPLLSLLVVFAEQVFAVDGFRYGLLAAAMGVGSILATPLVAGRGSTTARSVLAWVAMITYGISLVVFSLLDVYVLALVVLVVTGGAYLAVAATLNTSLQLRVEEARRGRVMALYVTAFTLAIPFGSLVQGVAAAAFGVRPTVVVAGLAYLVAVVALRVSGLLGELDDVDPVTSTEVPS